MTTGVDTCTGDLNYPIVKGKWFLVHLHILMVPILEKQIVRYFFVERKNAD